MSTNHTHNQPININHAKKQGETIKQLRKQKGLSQVALSKDGAINQICSARHLRKIENGEVTPSPYILNQFLQILGVSLEEFASLVYGQNQVKFNNAFIAIKDLFYDEKYAEASAKLDELKAAEYCNASNLLAAQALLFCDGVLLKNIENEYTKCLETQLVALKITAPEVASKNNIVLADVVASKPCSQNEYLILNLIANTQLAFGQTHACIVLLAALISSLENINTRAELKKDLFPGICFNLSNTLLQEKRPDEALVYCDKGIAFCETTRTYKTLGEFYYNKARVFYLLGSQEQCEKYFKRSYEIFINHGDINSANYVKNYVADNYQVII